MRSIPLILLLAVLCGVCSPAGAQEKQFPGYDTAYYTIYTDLDPDPAREAALRMTKMAEEYRARTSDFAGTLRDKMPVYIYKKAEDYEASGAPKGTAGYLNDNELVAIADWHTIQHEGFHQFARQVIRGEIPVWVNEGLAEYFGEALFTGDGFVSGVIPQWRLERIQKTIDAQQFKPLEEMMDLSHEQWNSDLAVINYDQGWSMVQFLAHGDEGKYQKAFGAFMGKLGQGRDWRLAWQETFGQAAGFELRWREYWTKLPNNPTIDLYAQANVATLTSFLGRAFTQRQMFKDLDEFARAGKAGQLKSHPQDWLPPSLIKEALVRTEELKKLGCTFSLVQSRPGDRPQILCTLQDGRQIIGRFTVKSLRIAGVETEVRKKG